MAMKFEGVLWCLSTKVELHKQAAITFQLAKARNHARREIAGTGTDAPSPGNIWMVIPCR
jgi:hypothetical protein